MLWTIVSTGPTFDLYKDSDPETTIAVNHAISKVCANRMSGIDPRNPSFYSGWDGDAIRIITRQAVDVFRFHHIDLWRHEVMDYGLCIGSLDLAVFCALYHGADEIDIFGASGDGNTKSISAYDGLYPDADKYKSWCERVRNQCNALARNVGVEINWI